ncbi:MAG: DUF3109 family protein [Cyclobacteriaceae bacterium]
MIIEIDDQLVSEEIADQYFVCDLGKCKGACCVEGDLGAPLEEEELAILDDEYARIEQFLTEEGKQTIAKEGRYVLDDEGDFSTTLINGKACAYVTYDDNGTTKCGIEQAHLAGETTFHKPISCHLYPIRVTKLADGLEALNYDRWPICDEARTCGLSLKVPLYQFVRGPLIRKYGQAWYDKLVELVKKR